MSAATKRNKTRQTGGAAGETLTAPQLAAYQALIAGSTQTAAAKAAGVHRATLATWLRSGEPLAAALKETQQAAKQAAAAALADLQGKAVAALARALDESAPLSIQLQAARTILDAAKQAANDDLADLAAAIAELKEQKEQQHDNESET